MAETLRCPQCGNQLASAALQDATARPASFPFCSDRCRLLDLGAWADGGYVASRPMSYEDLDDIDPAELQHPS